MKRTIVYLKYIYDFNLFFLKIIFSFFYLCSFVSLLHAEVPVTYEEVKTESKSKDSSNTDIHTFLEKKETSIDPTFLDIKPMVSLGYFNIFGLAYQQTLGINGLSIDGSYPFKLLSLNAESFLKSSFGNADLVSQTNVDSVFYWSFMLGTNATLPISKSNTQSYGVFGASLGFSTLANHGSVGIIRVDGGIDFIYHNFIFRPFLLLNGYVIALKDIGEFGMYGSLGLKILYQFQDIKTFLALALRQDFKNIELNTFVVMPDNYAMFLGIKTLSLDVNAEIQLTVFKNFGVSGNVGVLYASAYQNFNTYIQINCNYKF